MKKIVYTFLFLMAFISQSQAAVGVVIGAKQFSKDDGFPIIGEGEQVKAFICHGPMSGLEAASCAMKKCFNFYKINNLTVTKERYANEEVYGKHCTISGYAARAGHSIVAVGPKGDNQFIMSKALGDPTRDIAMSYVKSNNFPVNKATIVFDKYDDNNNGTDKPVSLTLP